MIKFRIDILCFLLVDILTYSALSSFVTDLHIKGGEESKTALNLRK